MPNALDEVRYEARALPTASSRMKACSTASAMSACAHLDNPNRYLLARLPQPRAHRGPDDILEFDLDSRLVSPQHVRCLRRGGVIHGLASTRPRPDVNAVCHHHSASILPFCVTGIELQAGLPHGLAHRRRPPRSGTPVTNSARPTCW